MIARRCCSYSYPKKNDLNRGVFTVLLGDDLGRIQVDVADRGGVLYLRVEDEVQGVAGL